MKTSKQLLLGAALLAGTFSSVGTAWSQGDTRLREGAPIGTPLNPGTPNSDRVMKIQQALKDKGFYSGPVDGVLGPKRRDAIRSFQQANKLTLTADKSLDDETARALGIQ